MKINVKTILLAFVLFSIHLLGLSTWKYSPKTKKVTKFWFAIVTSTITFCLVMYCLIVVCTVDIPNIKELSVGGIGDLFDFITRTTNYVAVPAMILPVWWYSKSWKQLYEYVGRVEVVLRDYLKDFNAIYVKNEITKRLFPVLMVYVIYVGIYVRQARILLYNNNVLMIPLELVYATLLTKVYVCCCVLHFTIAQKFISSAMFYVAKDLTKL